MPYIKEERILSMSQTKEENSFQNEVQKDNHKTKITTFKIIQMYLSMIPVT